MVRRLGVLVVVVALAFAPVARAQDVVAPAAPSPQADVAPVAPPPVEVAPAPLPQTETAPATPQADVGPTTPPQVDVPPVALPQPEQLPAASASIDPVYQLGFNRVAEHYELVEKGHPRRCQDACIGDNKCTAWAFETNGDRCRLMSQSPPAPPQPDECCVTGIKQN